VIHLPTEFDGLIEDIAQAGVQLTAMAACEGAAGNISVFTTSLACPLEVVDEVELPTPAAALADGWMVISASGRRLRDVGRRPESTIAALRINADGTRATMHANPSVQPSSEWNSHVAIHDDQRRRRGVDFHAVVHAQPLRTVFLSHLAEIDSSEELTRRLLRWEPETAVVAPEGVALAPFRVPGSPAQMEVTVAALAETVAVVWAKHGIVTRSDTSASAAADLVEYIEAAAHYEVMNLSLGSPAEGLNADERAAVADAFGLGV
jgi:rhamnulose-1-phosphate aldolase